MALGYVDSDMPSIIADEHVQNSLAIQRMNRLVRNDNPDIYCMNDACGEEIPLQRRMAIPGARFCVACQAVADRAGLRIVARKTYTHI